MKMIFKKIFVVGFICFLLIQFYQPARNTDNGQVLPTHITKVYNVPDNIKLVLTISCYDCHSNNTHYPWYSYIQPVRFILERDIMKGKENLNFSEWGNYSKRKQESKLDRIIKQIKSNQMPLSAYTLIHKNAILSTKQKEMIVDWIVSLTKNKD